MAVYMGSYNEEDLGQVLRFLDDISYTISDEFTFELREDTGLDKLNDTLDICFDRIYKILKTYYPESRLLRRYFEN